MYEIRKLRNYEKFTKKTYTKEILLDNLCDNRRNGDCFGFQAKVALADSVD